MTQTPQAKISYLSELDGIRAFSILFVLAGHMLPVGPSQWQLNAVVGTTGMGLFFCLSGFLITRFLYERPEIGVFLSRRIARILPLLVVYAFIFAVLIQKDWSMFLAAVFFYINYIDSILILGSNHLWSLCLEFHFYLSIGIAIWLFGKKGFWLVPIVALIVIALRIDAQAYISFRTHIRVDEILVGSMLALIWLNQSNRYAKIAISIFEKGFFVFALLLAIASHPEAGDINYLRPYFAMGVLGGAIFMKEGFVKKIFRLPILAYIAAISYALYVWHPMTVLGWFGEGSKIEIYFLKRPISFALTLALAHFSTHTFEKYFTDLARKKTSSGKKPA